MLAKDLPHHFRPRQLGKSPRFAFPVFGYVEVPSLRPSHLWASHSDPDCWLVLLLKINEPKDTA
jgi:hypothetical protein